VELLNRSKTSIVASFSAFRFQQGARGRIDGTGQRSHIYVVVQTYLHFPDFPTWEEAQPKNLPANFSALHVELLRSAHACFGLILSCPVRFYNNGTFSPG
jgi:hypothetical protein